MTHGMSRPGLVHVGLMCILLTLKISTLLGSPASMSVTGLSQDMAGYTVDGRNPADQLRLVVYPIIYRVLHIPGGARFLLSTVSSVSVVRLVIVPVRLVEVTKPKGFGKINRPLFVVAICHNGSF